MIFKTNQAVLFQDILKWKQIWSTKLSIINGVQIIQVSNFSKTCTYNANATIKTKPYDLHLLTEPPSATSTISKEAALKTFYEMSVIRKFENMSATLYLQKKILGFCHLYSGQEAICCGFFNALRPVDDVITSYRCHGWTYLLANSVTAVLSELMGKKSGCSRGKGGSMHMYAKRFLGGNGIVGGWVPLGTGMALAKKYKKTGGVTLTLYGDGAANQGQVYEAFNIAKLLNLPVVYVCENNRYAMGTATKRHAANPNFYKQSSFIPGIRLNGMDVLTVYEAAKYAINHCTSGKGPIVLEANTYRYFGHSMSDPGISYRSREEVQAVRKNEDPINAFKAVIISSGLATEKEIKKADDDAKVLVDKAAAIGEADSVIPVDELTADIYSKGLTDTVRGHLAMNPLKHRNMNAF